MASKAEKLRSKRQRAAQRGRPELYASSDDREQNGRQSRRKMAVQSRRIENERQVKDTVISARQRVHGINETVCDGQDAGSVLGRLYLAGMIKLHHKRAGLRFEEDAIRYCALTGIPFPNPRAIDLGKVRGIGRDANPSDARAAKDKFMRLEKCLSDVDVSGRPVATVVKRVCLSDNDDGIYATHMIQHLWRGLDALVDYYEISRSDD